MSVLLLETFPGRTVAVVEGILPETGSESRGEIKRLLTETVLAVVDARIVMDQMQVVCAVCATLVAERDARMLTKALPSELLYRLSGSNNVRCLPTMDDGGG